jgi:hypothetical protein
MINWSGAMAVYLGVGPHHRNADGRFTHKDGTPDPSS